MEFERGLEVIFLRIKDFKTKEADGREEKTSKLRAIMGGR